MEALEEIHEFISDPKYADDDAIGCTLTIIAFVGIIGWIVIGCNLAIGWIVPVACYLIAALCGFIWYYIDSDHIIMKYIYFLNMVILSGCGIFAVPLLLAFGILTMPLWIGKAIEFWKELK